MEAHTLKTQRRPAGRGFAPVWLWLLAWLCLGGGTGAADVPKEYQVKGAFLYNFIKFTEWPAGTFPTTNAPVTIGVLGANPFNGTLMDMIRAKPIGGRDVQMKLCASLAEAKACHVLFISASEDKQLTATLAALKGAPVLTVGDTEAFAKAGGMINFVPEGANLRFEINKASADAAGVKLSAQLLRLARTVRGAPAGGGK